MFQKIAYFITPHGYGHGTRAVAVMAAILEQFPQVRFEIFTRFPKFLIDQSMTVSYGYHELECDLGLVQKSALEIDFPKSIERLQGFFPFNDSDIQGLARKVKQLGCGAVFCDIAPMGIAVAKTAGLPSILTENFTWDWIYGGYLQQAPGLQPFIDYLAELDGQVTWRIQTDPIGVPRPGAFQTAPVVRKLRESREAIRRKLKVPKGIRLVMITMGGVGLQLDFLHQLAPFKDCLFLIPGQKTNFDQRILGLAWGDFYHPDLVAAVDVVIAKLGYSTFAEVYQAGVPFGYIERDFFRESPAIARYIREHMPGAPFTESAFLDGSWLEGLSQLLSMERDTRPKPNGADQIAQFVAREIFPNT